MLKQSVLYLCLSIAVVLLNKYVHMLLAYIDLFYLYTYFKLNVLFTALDFKPLVRKVILITLIPVLATGIPASIYWLIKRKRMPHFIPITWCLWLVLVFSILLIR